MRKHMAMQQPFAGVVRHEGDVSDLAAIEECRIPTIRHGIDTAVRYRIPTQLIAR